MNTRKGIVILFGFLIAFNGLTLAQQQKTLQEELQELRERTKKQNEVLHRSVQPDSPPLEKQPDKINRPPDSIIPPVSNKEPVIKRSEKPITNVFQNKKWSLEECIQYAIDHNINVKLLQLQQEEAEIQQNTAKNSRLPNLNAGMGQEWNYGRTEDLLAKLQNDRYDVWNQSVTGFNIQSVTPIFTGFKIPNQIERSKLELKVATQNLEKAKDDLSINITSLFLQVLFYKELYNINRKQLELSRTQIERTRLLVQAGNVPKSQLYDIEAQEAKDSVSVVDAQNNLDLAMLDLAQSLELERNTAFDVYVPNSTNDAITSYIKSIQPPDIIYDNALNIKPVIKGQEYKVESSKKALKIAEAGYYPQLDFTLGYRTHYQYVYQPTVQLNPATMQPVMLNPSFSDQIRNYGAKFIGLNLNIPIFNRFSVRNQVSSAKVNILSQQLILENNKKNLYKEIQTAYKNATAAQEKYRASDRAVKSANESFESVRKRYELGTATVFEFTEARTRLIQSQSEQAQAKYEFILRTKILDFYNGTPIKL